LIRLIGQASVLSERVRVSATPNARPWFSIPALSRREELHMTVRAVTRSVAAFAAVLPPSFLAWEQMQRHLSGRGDYRLPATYRIEGLLLGTYSVAFTATGLGHCAWRRSHWGSVTATANGQLPLGTVQTTVRVSLTAPVS
jgi:hypothetical protein